MKHLLITLFCLSAFTAKSQNLELHQLQSFIQHPVVPLADSLSKTGWLLRTDMSETKGNQLYQTFSFGNLKKEKGKALAWLRLHADDGNINQLYYQSPGAAQFDHLVSQIVQTGAEKKEVQSIEENSISTYYIGADYIYQAIKGNGSYTLMVMTSKQ